MVFASTNDANKYKGYTTRNRQRVVLLSICIGDYGIITNILHCTINKKKHIRFYKYSNNFEEINCTNIVSIKDIWN